ncbi:hypothetical protein ANCDUO_01162 [Ancylostoma duodenale]|uniref:Uncharacterized protein n=1 Tax=Ancylostoma duodenale TaxID=51022 RepID=A0A0C2HA28_9BILA|nr:hypothetical protein ANCDUO_01162 [Ancylostoma duodenale]
MKPFYLNIPWIIDQTEYYCSSRSHAEWQSRGSFNPYQGTYFAIYGLIFITGAVLCSSLTLDWIAGQLSITAWSGATFNCVVLGINRVMEMIPAMQPFRILFNGKLLFVWMFLSVLYMVGRSFVTRSAPFNTALAAFVGPPFISDDSEWNGVHSIDSDSPHFGCTLLYCALEDLMA